MAIYVTKKCPYCGYTYQFHQSGDQRKYGCPYQTCLRCGKSYWDTDIKEPALHGYKNSHEAKESIKRGISLVIYGPLGIIFLSGGIFMVTDGEMSGIFLLAMGGYIAWVLGSYFKQRIHDKKHRDEIIADQQSNYDASKARLNDINYLTALAKHDPLAEKLLKERINGDVEHYATRPQ